jgi:hypothetical protein
MKENVMTAENTRGVDLDARPFPPARTRVPDPPAYVPREIDDQTRRMQAQMALMEQDRSARRQGEGD